MTGIIEKLAKAGHKAAKAVMDAFNPDQPRDEKGMWSGGEGGTAVGSERQDTPSSRRITQKELPAIQETPVKVLAPGQKIPVGNERDPRFGSDPNKITQRDLKPVTQADINQFVTKATWGGQKTELGARSAAASIVAEKSGSPVLHQRAAQAHYEAGREAGFGSPEREFHEKASQYHKTATYEISKNDSRSLGGRAPLTRQDRQAAAAASAGRWASKALETAGKARR